MRKFHNKLSLTLSPSPSLSLSLPLQSATFIIRNKNSRLGLEMMKKENCLSKHEDGSPCQQKLLLKLNKMSVISAIVYVISLCELLFNICF